MTYMNKCDLCGKFHKMEPGIGYKMIYSGYPPEPDHEITRCKPCMENCGEFEPQHGIIPDRSCGVIK